MPPSYQCCPQFRIFVQFHQLPRKIVGITGSEIQSRITADFPMDRYVCCDNGNACGHTFNQRETESLCKRRRDQHIVLSELRIDLLVRDVVHNYEVAVFRRLHFFQVAGTR